MEPEVDPAMRSLAGMERERVQLNYRDSAWLRLGLPTSHSVD